MKFYSFGDTHLPTILLLPSEGCHWSCFYEGVSYLKRSFHVIIGSYTGFEGEDTFTTLMHEIEEIETYLIQSGYSHLDIIYGSSWMTKIIMSLITKGRIRIGHVFLSSPETKTYSSFQADLKASKLAKAYKEYSDSHKVTGVLKKKAKEVRDHKKYVEYAGSIFLKGKKDTITYESYYNQIYEAYTYKVDTHTLLRDTKVSIIYNMALGKELIKTYMHLYDPVEIIFYPYYKEEYLITYPLLWARDIKKYYEEAA